MSEYVIITSSSCGRCQVVKKLLTEKGVPYREVTATSVEGQRMIKVFDVKMAGTIIDINNQKVVDIKDVA